MNLHFENLPYRWPRTYAEAICKKLQEIGSKRNYSHKDIGPLNMFDNPATVGEGIFRKGILFTKQVMTIRHWSNMANGPGHITVYSKLCKILPESELQKIVMDVKNNPEEKDQPIQFNPPLYDPFARGLI